MSHEFGNPPKSLVEILGDEKLQEYAFDGDAALMLNQVPDDVRGSDNFQRMLGVIGWPDEEDARNMEPVGRYQDLRDFMDASFSPSFVDEAGQLITRSDELNNFHALMRYKPAEIGQDGQAIVDQQSVESKVASTHPALMRAQALVPDLLSELRVRFDAQATEKKPYPSTMEVYESDPYVVQAAYTAYRVIGRLVSRYDLQISALLNGRDKVEAAQLPLETSPHESLIR